MNTRQLKSLIKEQIRQVLKENSEKKNSKPIMINGKEVDIESLQSEPSTSTTDAYIIAAKFTDGTKLKWQELEQLETKYPYLIGFASHSLRENINNTIDYKKLKKIYTLASKLKLYESYIVDETIEDMRRLENAVKTNDKSVFEEMEESQIDTYELQGLAKLNPEQQAEWKGIDIALRELSRIIYKMDLNLIGEKFKKLAVAINNFK